MSVACAYDLGHVHAGTAWQIGGKMASVVTAAPASVSVDRVVSERVQAAMVAAGVSVDMLAGALGVGYPDALCKLAGCGEWTVNDVFRASLLLGVEGASLLP